MAHGSEAGVCRVRVSAAGVRTDSVLVSERRPGRGRVAAPVARLSGCPLRRLRAARPDRPVAPGRLPDRRVLPAGAPAGGGGRPPGHEGDPVRRGQLPERLRPRRGGGREPGPRQPGDGAVEAYRGRAVRRVLAPQHRARAARSARVYGAGPAHRRRRRGPGLGARAGAVAARHRPHRGAGRALDGDERVAGRQRRPRPRRVPGGGDRQPVRAAGGRHPQPRSGGLLPAPHPRPLLRAPGGVLRHHHHRHVHRRAAGDGPQPGAARRPEAVYARPGRVAGRALGGGPAALVAGAVGGLRSRHRRVPAPLRRRHTGAAGGSILRRAGALVRRPRHRPDRPSRGERGTVAAAPVPASGAGHGVALRRAGPGRPRSKAATAWPPRSPPAEPAFRARAAS